MNQTRPTFREVVVKTIVTHTLTYFLMGLLAFVVLDYARLYADTSLNLLMRQTSEPLVMAGPLFQPIRGLLFGIVFYLLREPCFGKKNGWLVMWTVLVVVGVIGTFGPSPGSLEGVIYTVLPLWLHLRGLPEVLVQSLLLSWVLFHWVNRPQKWLSWSMGLAFFIALLLPVLGLLVGQPR
ncbi:MAG: hypothetical protein ACR2L2_02955 [Acidobacteriota bacterium]